MKRLNGASAKMQRRSLLWRNINNLRPPEMPTNGDPEFLQRLFGGAMQWLESPDGIQVQKIPTFCAQILKMLEEYTLLFMLELESSTPPLWFQPKPQSTPPQAAPDGQKAS